MTNHAHLEVVRTFPYITIVGCRPILREGSLTGAVAMDHEAVVDWQGLRRDFGIPGRNSHNHLALDEGWEIPEDYQS